MCDLPLTLLTPPSTAFRDKCDLPPPLADASSVWMWMAVLHFHLLRQGINVSLHLRELNIVASLGTVTFQHFHRIH